MSTELVNDRGTLVFVPNLAIDQSREGLGSKSMVHYKKGSQI